MPEKLSQEAVTSFFRICFFILLLIAIYCFYIKDYFVVFLLMFPIIGWSIYAKLFSLNKISFNEQKIYIGRENFELYEIEKLQCHPLLRSFVQIKSRKYYFTAPLSEFSLDNRVKKLRKNIDACKNIKRI